MENIQSYILSIFYQKQIYIPYYKPSCLIAFRIFSLNVLEFCGSLCLCFLMKAKFTPLFSFSPSAKTFLILHQPKITFGVVEKLWAFLQYLQVLGVFQLFKIRVLHCLGCR